MNFSTCLHSLQGVAVRMADSSTNSGAGNKQFSIPSIDDIAQYEKQRPKVRLEIKFGP